MRHVGDVDANLGPVGAEGAHVQCVINVLAAGGVHREDAVTAAPEVDATLGVCRRRVPFPVWPDLR